MDTRKFAEFDLSRLVLGTAQLGLPYGIANKVGRPSYESAKEIIKAAYEGGVNCLDTAAVYGEAEEVIGKALADLGIADEMTVVTKVTYIKSGLNLSVADKIVEESVVNSLKLLKLEALPVCLSHVDDNFREYSDSLLKLKDRGLVRHVGASVNHPEQTRQIVRSGRAEAIQMPTSVLDQRFIRQGILKEAAERQMGVFVRSIYLQGLLLIPEEEVLPELTEVIPVRRKLRAIADEAGITLTELAVRFLLAMEGVTSLVVGAETPDQVRDNIAVVSKGPLDPTTMAAVSHAVPDLPQTILFPRLWSKRMPDVKPKGAESIDD